MTVPQAKVGDSFLLFESLPYNFDEDLPIEIGPFVYLDYTPQDVLARVKPCRFANFVLPSYSLGGGITHCCLHRPVNNEVIEEPGDSFYRVISSLRLYAPIEIWVAGEFVLGPDWELIRNPLLYYRWSTFQPKQDARYSGKEIYRTSQIAQRLFEIENLKFSRFWMSFILFAQVSSGHSCSLHMAYLTLFAALEALFVPNKDKAKAFSKRITNFISSFNVIPNLNSWLEYQYRRGRNKIAHGLGYLPGTPSRFEAFERLHEITRLCILGFLSLDNEELDSHSRKTGSLLQMELDNLGPACGRFLDGQKMWCS